MATCEFESNDFRSPSGMQTAVWGPLMWGFLHAMSFNYPVEPTRLQRRRYCRFLLTLGTVLPCRYCRENFMTNLKTAKFSSSVLRDRHSFSRFIYDLHNCVSDALGKDAPRPTFDDVRHKYELCRSRCGGRKGAVEAGCVKPFYGQKMCTTITIKPR